MDELSRRTVTRLVRRRPPEPLWRHLVGAVLRDERRRQGRTLREVADPAGISVPYLSEVERGRKEASSEILAAASRALGLRLADLLDRAHDLLAEHEGRTVVTVVDLAPGQLPASAAHPAAPAGPAGVALLAA